MSFLEELISRKKHFRFDDEKHYDLFYFENKKKFRKFKAYFEDSDIKYKLSTWYGKLTEVVTIVNMPQIEDLSIAEVSKKVKDVYSQRFNQNNADDQENYPILFVAPAQRLDPDHIIGVFEEYLYSFRDVEKYIENGELNKFRSGNIFTIYISVRFSQLQNHKMRSLFLCELFDVLISAVETYSRREGDSPEVHEEEQQINIAMYWKDAYQTGLFSFIYPNSESTSTNHGNQMNSSDHADQKFINISVTLRDLRRFVSKLKTMDPLVIDTVVFADDIDLLGLGARRKLRFTSQGTGSSGDDGLQKSVSGDRSLDEGKLKDALEKSMGIVCRRDQGKSNPFTENLDKAVTRLIFLLNVVGMSYDGPVKYIKPSKKLFKTSHHLIKQPSSTKKNVSSYQSYIRRVRHVDTYNGYRIKIFNAKYWFLLILAFLLSIAYGIGRRHEDLEDILQTITSLVTLIVGAAAAVILNTFYKGEAFFDVLSNCRLVDTQEEFEQKSWKETSDIVEVLQLCRKAPMFFGKGSKTSFLPRSTQNVGLRPKKAMPFSNLEAVGYGLFECKKGCLYVVDPWDNVFRAYIVRNENRLPAISRADRNHGEPYIDNEQTNPTNSTRQAQLGLEPTPLSNSNHGTMQESNVAEDRADLNYHLRRFLPFFKPKEEAMQPLISMELEYIMPSSTSRLEMMMEELIDSIHESEKARNRNASSDKSRNSGDGSGRLERRESRIERGKAETFGYKVVTEKGRETPLLLSRVLPYKKRKRAVGFVGHYTQYDTHWSIVDNRDLFRMEIGTFTGIDNPNDNRHPESSHRNDRQSTTKPGIWKSLFGAGNNNRVEISTHPV